MTEPPVIAVLATTFMALGAATLANREPYQFGLFPAWCWR